MWKIFPSKKSPREKFDGIVQRLCRQPKQAWDVLQISQVVQNVEPIDPSTPKPTDHTRFVCISDTHSLKNFDHPIPDGDVLIHAGDFTMVGKESEVKAFSEFIESQSHEHKVVIAGNHDIVFDEENFESLFPYWSRSLGEKADVKEVKRLLQDRSKVLYLEDSQVTINGIHIYGSPWYVVIKYFNNLSELRCLQVVCLGPRSLLHDLNQYLNLIAQ